MEALPAVFYVDRRDGTSVWVSSPRRIVIGLTAEEWSTTAWHSMGTLDQVVGASPLPRSTLNHAEYSSTVSPRLAAVCASR